MASNSSVWDIPTLDRLIREAFLNLSGDLHVALPGTILAYDPSTQLASVLPSLKVRRFAEAVAVPMPPVHRIPVVFPRTQSALIHFPVLYGDQVTLIFSDRSLEQWIGGSGEPKETLDDRQHAYSDAWALLGGYPKGNPASVSNTHLEIILRDGIGIQIKNSTAELLDLIYQLLTEQLTLNAALAAHTHGVATDPTLITALAAMTTTITTIQTLLTTLKGV